MRLASIIYSTLMITFGLGKFSEPTPRHLLFGSVALQFLLALQNFGFESIPLLQDILEFFQGEHPLLVWSRWGAVCRMEILKTELWIQYWWHTSVNVSITVKTCLKITVVLRPSIAPPNVTCLCRFVSKLNTTPKLRPLQIRRWMVLFKVSMLEVQSTSSKGHLLIKTTFYRSPGIYFPCY